MVFATEPFQVINPSSDPIDHHVKHGAALKKNPHPYIFSQFLHVFYNNST
jgi:hypothetical protein